MIEKLKEEFIHDLRFCETLLMTTRSVGYRDSTSSLMNERSARSDSISKLCLRPCLSYQAPLQL